MRDLKFNLLLSIIFIYPFSIDKITNNSFLERKYFLTENINRLSLPTDGNLPRMLDGRHYPIVPNKASEVADLIVFVEEALRSSSTSDSDLPLLGHQQQVIYRFLSRESIFSEEVLFYLPEDWRRVVDRHLSARREFLKMHANRGRPLVMPAWRVIAPEPPENLLSYFKKAEQLTGIDWEVLAAINLVETGMGRIDGVSVANAQGPMQFLPSTWLEKGIGQGGDIKDANDSIQAAARYLVRRGGLIDIRKGLWGYNNSENYVEAVLEYANLMKDDPKAFIGLYHWEIHYQVEEGDLWLPVGYFYKQRIPISKYLKIVPASAPPPTLPLKYRLN